MIAIRSLQINQSPCPPVFTSVVRGGFGPRQATENWRSPYSLDEPDQNSINKS